MAKFHHLPLFVRVCGSKRLNGSGSGFENFAIQRELQLRVAKINYKLHEIFQMHKSMILLAQGPSFCTADVPW